MEQRGAVEVRVWDPLVRWGHWALVAAFAVAYLSGDDLMSLHAWMGYAIGAWLVVRLAWGFVGPRHARFASFVRPPGESLAYLRDLALRRSPRFLGHSPAGGAMVVALMAGLAGTVGTGLVTWGAQGRGPLAGVMAPWQEPAAGGRSERREGAVEEAFEEAHELLANLTVALALLHLAGVAWASLAHRENLPRAMVTGRKRP